MVNYRRKRFYRAILFEELQLAGGNAFQQLFSRYMFAVYGADFSNVRPSGSLGDGGCDGYRYSTHTVYQCYGKNVSSGVDSKAILKKVTTDFETAKSNFPGLLMQQWSFAHNIKDGLPHEVVKLIVTLDAANPRITVGQLGPDGIESLLFELPETRLDDLFKLPEDDGTPLQPENVQRLLKGLLTSQYSSADLDFRPVPLDKIEYNKLGEIAARTIRDNTKYAAQVATFVNSDPDPLFGDLVAKSLKDRYQSLRTEQLAPDMIVDRLTGFIVGDRLDASLADLKAAEAILAYFFDECEIFENRPISVTADAPAD